PLLEVAGVTVRFGGVTAVDDVSFDVHEGELLGLIGPNGAGKTTILRAITGVVRTDSGKITLRGEPLDALSIDARIRKGLALSQQIVKPFREISVLDNVVLAAGFAKTRFPMGALLNLSQVGERKTAHAMLSRVDIAGYSEQSPAILPLGILKRLEMARALAQNPRLLLLDEPLAGLNSKESEALATTIADINRQGLTIILIEHNLGEILRVSRRLLVMDNGRKIADGVPMTVMNDPSVRAAYLGGEPANLETPNHVLD
ncbi:MAG: ABC transporter ATP-binding protein, partial [Desulfatirhabdiaceae bacterium]